MASVMNFGSKKHFKSYPCHRCRSYRNPAGKVFKNCQNRDLRSQKNGLWVCEQEIFGTVVRVEKAGMTFFCSDNNKLFRSANCVGTYVWQSLV